MEDIILEQLVSNGEFTRRVMPHLNEDVFNDYEDKLIFKMVKAYVSKYTTNPTYDIIKIATKNNKKLSEDLYTKVSGRILAIEEKTKARDHDYDVDWLMDETEVWFKDKSVENAIVSAVEIIQDEKKPNASIVPIVQDAISISFNNSIGIELLDDADIRARRELSKIKVQKFPLGITKFNDITDGGIEPKTLSVFLGDTHSGKTNAMVSAMADLVKQGFNCLYISLEMSKEKIVQRLEANLLHVEINNIPKISDEEYYGKIDDFAKNGKCGRAFVEEFPTGVAKVSHFRRLLQDLKIKKKFVPQIIFVDYLNLMCCERFANGGMYETVKGIAEELRGLGVEYGAAMVSATQSNRGGAKSSELDMADTAESYGLPATCDLMIAIMSPEELREQGIQIWKSLKNRMAGVVNYKFPVRTIFEFATVTNLERHEEEQCQIINTEHSEIILKKNKNYDKLKALRMKVNNDDNKQIETIFN